MKKTHLTASARGIAGWLAILNVLVSIPAFAASIPGLFNTGVDSNNVPLVAGGTDPHYRLADGSAVTGATFVVTAPGGQWLGSNLVSSWVAPATNGLGTNAPDGQANYRYDTTFDLTGLDPQTALITGLWATDNGGIDILINGIETAQTNTLQFSDFTYFQINNGFAPGRNTLTFLVNNGANEPASNSWTGLRVEMTGTAAFSNSGPFRLSIQRVDEQHIRLEWPVTELAFEVREATTLNQTQGWATVNTPVVTEGGGHTATLTVTNGDRFFRLQQVLGRRATFPKPAQTLVDTNKVDARTLVLKFHEGTHIRLRSGILTFDPARLSPQERALLARVDLATNQVQAGLAWVNQFLQDDPQRSLARMFEQPEEELARNKAEGESLSGEELADLDLYYHLVLPQADPVLAASVIDNLNQLQAVEVAYAAPLSTGAACVDLPPTTTINVMPSQGYLMPAPLGIDAVFAWGLAGGRGAGVRVIDVEAGWHLDHEDLPGRQFFQQGIFLLVFEALEHGTAVLGELVGCANSYGATGIVPDADYGVSSVVTAGFFTAGVPAAINSAAAALRPGDVILIEQHAPGPGSGLTCNPGCYDDCGSLSCQFEYVPMENWQADFDAIRTATARGIIVVEAAGNGSMNLDAPRYGGRFNRAIRDSGAILVGAGTSSGRNAWCFSNFGSRVDVQGWGDSVATLGYGGTSTTADPTLRANGADPRQWYRRNFNGTSSASPIVAGAACSIQGVRRANGLPLLSPLAMRSLLRNTGTLQPFSDAVAMQIGRLPDLKKALNTFFTVTPPLPPGTHVWVDFKLPGFSAGDGSFNKPFNTLHRARQNVPAGGGTIHFKTGLSGNCCNCSPPRDCFPATITEPMNLVAFDGPVVIGR